MSWSFWRSNSQVKQQPSSIIDRTQSFISNSFRRQTLNLPNTSQFEDYLASLPSLKRITKKKKSASSVSTLKPQLVKKCMQVVDKQYFDEQYQISEAFFQKKLKVNQERQMKLQQQLDEVQVCLFNQITSRFDQILSVLRTIQSLDFLVVDNQKKLKTIRQDNFNKVLKVAKKQTKMAALIKQKKNIEAVLQLASKIKQYKQFKQIQSKLDSSDSVQIFYSSIPIIKANIPIYTKLKATKNVAYDIQQTEATLKRSFSDKINDKILEYLKKQIPYQTEFWKKYINNNKILQDRQEGDSTVLLDESAIVGQQESIVVLAKKDDIFELIIMDLIQKGWQDGQYVSQKLKMDIDTLLKSKHNAFMLDFRNFSDQICKKNQIQVQNPSLTNLLHSLTVTFCSKVYNYFFDIHKSILLRFFSILRKVYEFVINKSKNNLSIDQKQKINLLTEGFTTTATFLMRLILQKLVDISQTKIIHEGIDISEIKLIVGVTQNAESFLQKLIATLTQIPESQNSFLADFFFGLSQRLPIKILQIAKKKKLYEYLNKMHKNAIQVELKQKLENQIWQPTDIPTYYYDSLHYLITGQSLNLRRNKHNLKNQQASMLYQTSVLMDHQKQQSFFQQPSKMIGNFRIIRNDIIINGKTYKVTLSLLLLLELLEDYLTLAQNFPSLKQQIGHKINQIIRSYNISSCQLIVHAGAVALQKIKSKNITARHLALSSLCLSFILYIMQCVQKRMKIADSQKLKTSIQEHIDMIYKKLNQILFFKANSLKADINLKNTPSKGTEGIVSNAKILLQILSDFYGKDVLDKIFTKQFLNIYVETISNIQITSKVEAQALKDDVAFFFGQLKGLEVLNNDFLERRIAAEDIVRKAFEQL